MNDTMITDSRDLYSPWLQMMSSVVWGQWRVLDAQYQVGLDLLRTITAAKEIEPKAGQAPGGLSDLESRALERVRKGFPPPPEVYEAQNRSRIDWSRFPEWAWPTDPDLFTGTHHEG